MVQFTPEEELNKFQTVQWAPMVDFLFIVIIVFATIAMTRNVAIDEELRLANAVQTKENQESLQQRSSHIVNLSINNEGKYKWLTESNALYFESANQVSKQLQALKKENKIPANSKQMKILLHIDKSAPWQPIADVIFAIRQAGYDVHPVYRSTSKE